MLNSIFYILIVGAFLTAAYTLKLDAVSQSVMTSATAAVELSLSLVGQMSMWLGFLAILREAGVTTSLANWLKPLMVRLFPEVPPDHPAMGAMVLNISANMLGLGNAATPFGIKAMQELNRLNPHPTVATNAMALFLAINTSGVTLFATEIVSIRSALGSHHAGGILLPALFATSVSTAVAILATKLLERLPRFSLPLSTQGALPAAMSSPSEPLSLPAVSEEIPASAERRALRQLLVLLLAFSIAWLFFRHASQAWKEQSNALSVFKILSEHWLIPGLILMIVTLGFARKVKVYEVFVEGAQEGFRTAIGIIPYLVAILVAVGMLRASGGLDWLVGFLDFFTRPLGFPAEALPMALMRPLSGSGAKAILAETMKTYGPDSFIGYLVSTIHGSTETTFYVLAVYFGSVQIRITRHTLWACLMADFAGIAAATVVTYWLF